MASKKDYYVRRRKICTITHTGVGWAHRTLQVIWKDSSLVWTARNEAIHGHNNASQHQAHQRKVQIKMEALDAHCHNVLACDTDIFIGDNQAELSHYLDTTKATQGENWLNTWKPFILSRVQSAKDLSIQGVQTMTAYFPGPVATRRPITSRPHQKAQSKLRNPHALPQPNYRFQSLRSFLVQHP